MAPTRHIWVLNGWPKFEESIWGNRTVPVGQTLDCRQKYSNTYCSVNIPPPKNCGPLKITFSTVYYFSVTHSHRILSLFLSRLAPLLAHQPPKCQDSHFYINVWLMIQLDSLASQFPIIIITNNFTPLNTIISRPVVSPTHSPVQLSTGRYIHVMKETDI